MNKCRRLQERRQNQRRSIAIMSIPHEDNQRILSDINYLLHHTEGAREYFDFIVSQAQVNGITLDKEQDLV